MQSKTKREIGVPPLPERPKTTPTNPKDEKEVAKVNASIGQFLDDAARTVRGQMEVAEMLGGDIPSLGRIRSFNEDNETKLTDREWQTVYERALNEFINTKSGR